MEKETIDWQHYFAGVQTNHTLYFLSYAEANAEADRDHYQALAEDHPNLMIAIDTAISENAMDNLQRLTWALGKPYDGYLSNYGDWKTLTRLIQSAISASDQLHESLIAAGFMIDLGTILFWQGQMSEAEHQYKSALGILRSGPQDRTIDLALGGAYHHLGRLFRSQAQFSQAHIYLHKALNLYQKWDNQSSIANTLQELGSLANDQENLSEALDYYQQSLVLNQALPDSANAVISKRNIGNILYQQGNHDQAERCWHEALAMFTDQNDRRNMAGVLQNLAQLALDHNDIEKARQLCLESITIKEEIGFQSELCATIGLLGVITYAEGNPAQAEQIFRQAINLGQKVHDHQEANRQRFNLALLYELTGQFPMAAKLLEQTVATDRAYNLPDLDKDEEALRRILTKLSSS